MAPVILALREVPGLAVTVCSSGQHAAMTGDALRMFGLEADVDLQIMRPGQTLFHVTSTCLDRCEAVYASVAPDLVLVHGDTSTALAMALGAFYRRIPVAHVEAGLRSGDRESPFPEEMNRQILGRLSSLHFAPTSGAAENLLREGVAAADIHVTGNTGIDALFRMRVMAPRLAWLDAIPGSWPVVLLTVHRRENHGEPLRRIFAAVRRVAEARPDACFVYPVHPNPAVQEVAGGAFEGIGNVFAIPPMDYAAMARVLERCRFLLTDSGGLQEEGVAAGKPVLVLRDRTERPEALECGGALLVGCDEARIQSLSIKLLQNSELYRAMSSAPCPFGDGKAAGRVTRQVVAFLENRPGARNDRGTERHEMERTQTFDRDGGPVDLTALVAHGGAHGAGCGERPLCSTV